MPSYPSTTRQPPPVAPPRRRRTSGRSISGANRPAQNDDWSNVSDLAERRRIQNRLAQRSYRKRIKARVEIERQHMNSTAVSAAANAAAVAVSSAANPSYLAAGARFSSLAPNHTLSSISAPSRQIGATTSFNFHQTSGSEFYPYRSSAYSSTLPPLSSPTLASATPTSYGRASNNTNNGLYDNFTTTFQSNPTSLSGTISTFNSSFISPFPSTPSLSYYDRVSDSPYSAQYSAQTSNQYSSQYPVRHSTYPPTTSTRPGHAFSSERSNWAVSGSPYSTPLAFPLSSQVGIDPRVSRIPSPNEMLSSPTSIPHSTPPYSPPPHSVTDCATSPFLPLTPPPPPAPTQQPSNGGMGSALYAGTPSFHPSTQHFHSSGPTHIDSQYSASIAGSGLSSSWDRSAGPDVKLFEFS